MLEGERSDRTAALFRAAVVQREWPGLYAKQFNWALDNLPIEGEWILRLDADAYYKLPRYFRAVAYFCIRYFLKRGFLDGRAGWRWHFWQGLWYRWLVDREIGSAKRGGF
jgi:glycosyltransferase involved in cell wall biosynthesis